MIDVDKTPKARRTLKMDPAGPSREDKLKSAKQKLKKYKERQQTHRASHSKSHSRSMSKRFSVMSTASTVASTCVSDSLPPTPNKRQSFRQSTHVHRRTLSRNIIALDPSPIKVIQPVIEPLVSPAAIKANRRRSTRHSRTESILNAPSPAVILSPLMQQTPIIQNKRHSLAGRKHSRTESILSVNSPEVGMLSGFLNSPVMPGISPTRPFTNGVLTPKSAAWLASARGNDTDRLSALQALEGSSPSSYQGFQAIDLNAATNPVSKRNSWGLGVSVAPAQTLSMVALQGGKGANDLGMVIEEEEEEEDETSGQTETCQMMTPSSSMDDLDSIASPSRSRQRPSSLFLPTSLRPAFGVAYNAVSPALTSSSLATHDQSTFTPNTPYDSAATTPQSTTFSAGRRGLKNLSLSSTVDQDIMRSQRRMSGLKSLTLNGERAVSPTFERSPLDSRRRSTALPSSSSVALNASRPRRSSVASTPNRRPSASRSNSRASTSHSNAVSPGSEADMSYAFGDLVMQDEEQSESNDSEHSFANNSISSMQSASQLANLKADLDHMRQDLARANAELASRADSASRHRSQASEEVKQLTYRVFEAEGMLEAKKQELAAELDSHKIEVEALNAQIYDANSNASDLANERDDLREDVEGWRRRCNDLERSLERERAKTEDERKEAVVAREKARKLADRLATLNTAHEARAPVPAADPTLVAAQAKLVGEMRDQIFALASALDRERQKTAELQHRETFSDASVQSSVGQLISSPISQRSSFSSINSTSQSKPMTEPNLDSLVEEDEEESAWVEDEEVPELDYAGTQSLGIHSQIGSTASSSFNDMPSTPRKDSRHIRSESFIKQWRFPTGRVTPVIVEADDHSFFSLSYSEVLPALPVIKDSIELAPFFASDLVLDEAEARSSSDSAPTSRLSIQNFINATSPILCNGHTREESVFVDDHHTLLHAPRTISKIEQPPPVASALRYLDFRNAFLSVGSRLINI